MMASHTYPFRNLVFQGGGMKMFGYHGALQILEEAGILSQIERVGGSSSGSLTAALVSFRLSTAETVELARTIDYTQAPTAVDDDETPLVAGIEQFLSDHALTAEAGSAVSHLPALMRLASAYGWYTNRKLYRGMCKLIEKQCGDERATFADFQQEGFRDLYVVATNLSKRRSETFSAETTPAVAVADALLLSQSIPLYFEAARFDGDTFGRGDYYADGGVMDNFPIHLFDETRYVADPARFSEQVNYETLGCRFFTPDDCEEETEIENLIDYVVNLFLTLNEAEDIEYLANPKAQVRTVEISNCCISSRDFDLAPEPEDERYQELVAAGRKAMRAFLDEYDA